VSQRANNDAESAEKLVVAALAALTRGNPSSLDPVFAIAQQRGFSTGTVLHAWKDARGTQPVVIDDEGSISYREMCPRVRAIAAALFRRGHEPGSRIGLLCRNHRYFVEALCAGLQAGCDVVLMNTGFAGPQLADVARREGIAGLIADPEFLAELSPDPTQDSLRYYRSFAPSAESPCSLEPGQFECLETLAHESLGEWSQPARPGTTVILTSGTTGTPKGATRGGPEVPSRTRISAELLDSLVRLQLRIGQRVLIAPPLFHAWGLKLLFASLTLGSTVVTSARFDPLHTLRLVEDHEVEVLGVVPVMLQRMLAVPESARRDLRLERLAAVVVSGSALAPSLASSWMDAFGDHIHNMYGSTEVGAVSIANPEDHRQAPGSVGQPIRGVSVRILDDQGTPLPANSVGRIFVRTNNLFSGYTGGGSKEWQDDHMATGDVGHLDEAGRLYVEGRSDDMVISGGENVFPSEVEDLLLSHPEIEDAAVVGVADAEFGQRLCAYVVARPGAALDETAVRDYVRDHLARYKVPREVAFLEELPRNAAGKVLKRLLR